MARVGNRPRVGISRCLLGDAVRYDGGHKRDSCLVEALGRYVEWVSVCPEVEVGMGTPREPIHLVTAGDGVTSGDASVRLIGVRSGADWTEATHEWSLRRVRELARLSLCGYVLKADSPSCGLKDVRVTGGRNVTRTGRGLFAQALVDGIPNLPVEEETGLHDSRAHANFVERVVGYQHVRTFFGGRWTVSDLVAFHAEHAPQLVSHSPAAYNALGELVAGAKNVEPEELAAQYERAFMSALGRTDPGARDL